MTTNPTEEMMMDPTRSVTGGWGTLQVISVTQGNFHLANSSNVERVNLSCTIPSLGRYPSDLILSLPADKVTLAWIELTLSGWKVRSRYTVRFQLAGSADMMAGMVMDRTEVWSPASGYRME